MVHIRVSQCLSVCVSPTVCVCLSASYHGTFFCSTSLAFPSMRCPLNNWCPCTQCTLCMVQIALSSSSCSSFFSSSSFCSQFCLVVVLLVLLSTPWGIAVSPVSRHMRHINVLSVEVIGNCEAIVYCMQSFITWMLLGAAFAVHFIAFFTLNYFLFLRRNFLSKWNWKALNFKLEYNFALSKLYTEYKYLF